MADQRDRPPLRSDSLLADEGGRGTFLPGPVHARGARGDGAPVASRGTRRPGPSLPRRGEEDGRLDDDRDASGALAASWGGRLPVGAGSTQAEARQSRLRIAIPASGRLRE